MSTCAHENIHKLSLSSRLISSCRCRFLQKQGRSIYEASFDSELLGIAHEQCRAAFEASLCDLSCPLVIVDNTNSTLSEMAFYKRKAASAGVWSLDVVQVSPNVCHDHEVSLVPVLGCADFLLMCVVW